MTSTTLAEVTRDVSTVATVAWAWAVEFLPRLSGALIILFIGSLLANWASRGLNEVANRTGRIDATLRPVLVAIIRYTIYILAFVAVLGQLGVQTTSVLAVLGAAGLAIGLALQGTLANIAAGLMLLWLRPLKAGEYIETPSVAGIVQEVGLFATRLNTFDGISRFVPNSELWPKPITNHSRNPTRMLDIAALVTHDADTDRARSILLDLAKADERIMREPEPLVFIDAVTELGCKLVFRAWTGNAEFWPVQRRMSEEMVKQFRAAGIEFARPRERA